MWQDTLKGLRREWVRKERLARNNWLANGKGLSNGYSECFCQTKGHLRIETPRSLQKHPIRHRASVSHPELRESKATHSNTILSPHLSSLTHFLASRKCVDRREEAKRMSLLALCWLTASTTFSPGGQGHQSQNDRFLKLHQTRTSHY